MHRYYLAMCCVIMLLCGQGCADDHVPLFTKISVEQSGVNFVNQITVNDSFNILDYEYVYNGGGVGVGDFNNDGLDDLFFTGNMVDNALYLNKGDFSFQDISAVAGIQASGKWSSGVAVVDINADGKMDVYICNNTYADKDRRKNNLFINQGVNADGIPEFSDEAEAYGLADDSYSVNSAFFDYDNDNDLDVFIIINEMQETRFPGRYEKKTKRKEAYQRVDRLYEQVFNEEKGHPEFIEVSEKAGITVPGFSLGVNISDINQDGWQDIYITNDFLSNDVFYINQKDGTFKDEAKRYFKHTSQSAMGTDVVDINNDGLLDIIALDMLPEGNYRQKKLLGPNNYTFYINNERYDYIYQYVRNTLQLNQGALANHEEPLFSDISLMSGISATDWSWAPLVADFNNDGLKDIIVTNGFPKDVTDQDFVDYKANAARYASKEMMLSMIPEIQSKNCAFLNNGDLTFENMTDKWGFDDVSFSNGAAYSDLDNDGDLDVVINNIDSAPFIYQNNNTNTENSYIRIVLKGSPPNVQAIGTKVMIHLENELLTYVHSPFRGYLSTHSNAIHVGLGTSLHIDKLEVVWPDGTLTTLHEVKVNAELEILQSESSGLRETVELKNKYFEIDSTFNFIHEERDFIDYNLQALLPHKLSEYGPGISVADIDNNGFDDIYISGPSFYNGRFLMQSTEGEFSEVPFLQNDPNVEELGSLFFDADGDNDMDLYLVSGSYEKQATDSILMDRFFENINGEFMYKPNALPNVLHNGLNVKAADFDQDGDLDLVVGGRINQSKYPEPVDSYLYENRSDENGISFSDVTASIAQDLLKIGMVTDLLWTDFNADGSVDLIVVAELSEIIFLENRQGKFVKVMNEQTRNKKGFWNSIQGGDLDQDGDIDYVLGNRGVNQFNPINEAYPFRFYVNDFDNNGSTDLLPFSYFKDENDNYVEFPFMSRIDYIKEVNAARREFQSFESYAIARKSQIIPDSILSSTDIYEANYVYSSILRNNGSNGFSLEKLPVEAQLAPVYGTQLLDVDDDGLLDILLAGNDYGNEIFFGRQDALNGVCLLAREDNTYQAIKPSESGYVAMGNAKSLVGLYSEDQLKFVTGQNRGQINLHEAISLKNLKIWIPESDDHMITYSTDGAESRQELYYGSGFLSQSSRKVSIPMKVKTLQVTKYNGQSRTVILN